jgi:hypothetical protein
MLTALNRLFGGTAAGSSSTTQPQNPRDPEATLSRRGFLATAVTAIAAGCSPDPQKATPSLTNSTLPAVPKIVADQRIIRVLQDPKVPAVVLDALKNPEVHATLHRIATSSQNPVSYVRNAPYANSDCVVVLQHLLNLGREAAITQLLNYAEGLKQAARSMPPESSDKAASLQAEATGLQRYANRAPAALKLDGDYGPASHRLRGFFTMVKNIVSGLTFPHTKVDTGANDTAIGPLTLNALFQHDPGIGYVLLADPDTYRASLAALPPSPTTTNSIGKVSRKQPAQ